MPAIAFDRFYRYPELTAILHEVAAQHPDLVTLVSIGRSFEGRDIWLCEVTDGHTGAAATKPALWVDASIHATELTACTAALHLLHHLTTRHAHDAPIAALLAKRTVYIVPRVNPDGAELALADHPRLLRSSVRRWPWSDHVAPGLHVGDIDGDGRVLLMRIADPDGAWREHPGEPRVMVPRPPDVPCGAGCFRLLREGLVEEYDGATFAVAPNPEGLDLNRNFPAGWRTEGQQKGAGPYPTSEPEVRSLVQAIDARPNVAAYAALHTSGGFLFRVSSTMSDKDLPRRDVLLLEEIGAWLKDINGYPTYSVYDAATDPLSAMSGAADDWNYDHRGVVSFTPEIWDIGAASGLARTHPYRWDEKHDATDDVAIVAFIDRELGGRDAVPWYPFDHPQLGPVELGGIDFLNVFANPPPERREVEVEGLTRWLVRLAAATPRLEVHEATVQTIGTGSWRVRLVVKNTGWLPTNVTERATRDMLVKPLVAELGAGDGVRLASGSARVELGQLAGRALKQSGLPWLADGTPDRAKAEWVVAGPAGGRVTLRATHERAGGVEVVLTLGG